MGYTDIILEVANEYAGYADESDEESEEESDEESDEEEDNGWFPDENVMEILTDELWKKCMRKDKKDVVYYNLEKDYINSCLYSYLFYEIDEPIDNGVKEVKEVKDEPEENEYGGFWYHKGKNSQKTLQGFYEKFGYKEDPSVHNEWGCFTEIPYPSMRLEL